jgi:Uma2 family endonuclease
MPLGRPSQIGEPTWELASLYPHQGDWTESAYLALDERDRRMYELVHGYLEVLPMPTPLHQRIAFYLAKLLDAFVVARRLGEVLTAPCPVRLGDKHYREPDVFFLRPGRVKSADGQPEGADLVMEIVSPDPRDRDRDLVDKRRDYAQADISEYWIVDPQEQTITVLVLDGTAYREDGVYKPGETARSILLPGFEVDVAATFAAGR